MAIQQSLTFSIQLTGDGSATVFTYALGAIAALGGNSQVILNPGSLPVSVSTINPDGILPAATASLDGSGNVVITFASAPGLGITGLVTVQVFFAISGTPNALAGDPIALTDGTHGPVTVVTLANSKALAVGIVDGLGNQITSFGGGTQYADSAASGATPTGTLSMGWDSANSKVRALKVDASQNLLVDVGYITPPTLTKGTQGTTGFSVQDLKDAGRTYITLYAQLITGVTTEALATFTKNVGGTTTTGQTAYTITSGKTFKIQALTVQINNTTTVANNIQVNVRVAASVAASSPIVASCGTATLAAIATNKGFNNLNIPGGIDIAGNGSIQIGISHLENVTTASIASFTLMGYEY